LLLYDDGAFLVLPSGARIGHRSLARYFRQSLKPVDEPTDENLGNLGRPAKQAQLKHGKILAIGATAGGLGTCGLFRGKTGVSGLVRGVLTRGLYCFEYFNI
jgi:pre-60S factor REI1